MNESQKNKCEHVRNEKDCPVCFAKKAMTPTRCPHCDGWYTTTCSHPNHQESQKNKLDTRKKHDDAGLEGWIEDWMPAPVDALTLDGDGRGAKDRLRAIFAQQESLIRTQVVEEMRGVVPLKHTVKSEATAMWVDGWNACVIEVEHQLLAREALDKLTK